MIMFAIGMLVVGITLAVGMGLSAWKKEFGIKQYYCTNCCNPEHWSPEDRAKASAQQILIFDDVSFCIKKE